MAIKLSSYRLSVQTKSMAVQVVYVSLHNLSLLSLDSVVIADGYLINQ